MSNMNQNDSVGVATARLCAMTAGILLATLYYTEAREPLASPFRLEAWDAESRRFSEHCETSAKTMRQIAARFRLGDVDERDLAADHLYELGSHVAHCSSRLDLAEPIRFCDITHATDCSDVADSIADAIESSPGRFSLRDIELRAQTHDAHCRATARDAGRGGRTLRKRTFWTPASEPDDPYPPFDPREDAAEQVAALDGTTCTDDPIDIARKARCYVEKDYGCLAEFAERLNRGILRRGY